MDDLRFQLMKAMGEAPPIRAPGDPSVPSSVGDDARMYDRLRAEGLSHEEAEFRIRNMRSGGRLEIGNVVQDQRALSRALRGD